MAAAHETIERLGQAIRDARKARGMTQQDLADATGLSREYIHQLEAGRPTQQLERLVRTLNSLGIDLVAQPRGPRRA